jgi:hypothetical protein
MELHSTSSITNQIQLMVSRLLFESGAGFESVITHAVFKFFLMRNYAHQVASYCTN